MSVICDPDLYAEMTATVVIRNRLQVPDQSGGFTEVPYDSGPFPAKVEDVKSLNLEADYRFGRRVDYIIYLPLNVDGVDIPIDFNSEIILVTPNSFVGLHLSIVSGPEAAKIDDLPDMCGKHFEVYCRTGEL